ncbi:MAG: purine-nucleoside phosphorylase, partial [Candidatus Marinimicrobia bacterium]|nr:purine-nucleoside phosphorylase [Candidatus Neomarinimicrobiota bacterium]
VLGSGLNNLVDSMRIRKKLSYADIPDFPRSTVAGHEGAFVCGDIGNVPVLAAKGRFHYYEGYSLDDILTIMRSFRALNIPDVIITNAAGLMDPLHQPGDILLIRDCIDMTHLTRALKAGTAKTTDKERQIAMFAAKEAGIRLGEGVYIWTTGPSYETPAEIRYFRALGGDLVGMSTMPEIMWARENGMRVYPFSCATNWASGISEQPLTHEEVSETAQRVKHDLTRYVLTLCQVIGD